MKREYAISVAMATYNGEKYIKEQIDSILLQLNETDELVISDDGSTDKTVNIIADYKDKRIKLLKGPKKGVKQNFANAISQCSGKYIFLSDQDDIWMSDKVEKVLTVFEQEKCTLVVHDAIVFDSNTNKVLFNSFYRLRKSKKGVFKNICKNSYIGCCMTFKNNIIKHILPIPNDIEMHDQWIGIMCEKYGKSIFTEDKLIKYRRHGGNVSKMKHYSLMKMVKNRFNLVKQIIRRTWVNEKK